MNDDVEQPTFHSGTSNDDFLPACRSSLLTTSSTKSMLTSRLDSARDRLNKITKRMREDMGQLSDDEEDENVDDVKMGETLTLETPDEFGTRFSERYNEDSADIILVSSDGITFKVHSFALLRNS